MKKRTMFATIKNYVATLVLIVVGFFWLSSIYADIRHDMDRGKPSNSTPEPGYRGHCHHWTSASLLQGKETCIWGYPTSAVPGSWVWLHFSEKRDPYPDFAADIDSFYASTMKFTANNIAERYVGRCVEIYGKVVIEPNTYGRITAQQPVIHVRSELDIRFCN